jgi:carboxymethylenebutenolidase
MELDMREREIQIRREDGEMTTFVVHPDGGGPFSVAVLYMDGIGYREQVKENARRFAADGYYCVAPDLFYHAGKGVAFDMAKMMSGGGTDSPERQRMFGIVRSVTPARVVSDTRAILAEIESDPAAAPGPKVCVGYCMGARLALHVASVMPGEFVAAAGIHPGALVNDQPDSPHHELASVRGELYFAFAEQDRTATPESIDEFRRAMESNGVKGVVERLPGTSHGFAMADLPVYNPEAAERHFERTLELWRRSLQEASTPARA